VVTQTQEKKEAQNRPEKALSFYFRLILGTEIDCSNKKIKNKNKTWGRDSL
jgi:hypothetical protein